MNAIRFEAEIAREEVGAIDVVRERAYGDVRVIAAWPDDFTTPEIRLSIEVRGGVDRRDAPAYAELFFHDVFLLLNLAAPGSFAGTISMTGGDLRVREITFSAHLFAAASGVGRLPIERVIRWYDRLQIGTQQIAGGAVVAALFELLNLSRAAEDEQTSILRLASAAEALLGRPEPLRKLFELRDAIARGRTPVFHPMHDDALDPRVEDATRIWIEATDAAASAVIRALQAQVSP